MSPLKVFTRAMLVVVLLVGVVALSAPPAEANSSGPVCTEGVLTADGRCEVEVDTVGDSCPAIEADGECFELVPVTAVCEVGSLVGDECRISVPDTVELSCPPPSEPQLNDQCISTGPADESLVCPAGDLLAGSCLEFIASALQQPFCPNEGDSPDCFTTAPADFVCEEGTPSGEVCIILVDPIEGEPECPDASFTDIVAFDDGDHCGITTEGDIDCGLAEPIGDGLCRDSFFSFGCQLYYEFEIDLELELAFEFIEEWQGGCYGFSFDGPNPPCPLPLTLIFDEICAQYLGEADACPEGYDFDGEECSLIFEGAAICEADFPLFLGFDDGGDPVCYQDFGLLVASSECPTGSNDINGDCLAEIPGQYECTIGELTATPDCRIAEDPVLSNPFCPVGVLIDGGCYDDLGAPVTVLSCPADGGLVDGVCLYLFEPIETATCGDADGVPGDCFILELAAFECPAGTTAGAEFPASCRQAVDRVGDACPDGTIDLDGRCVQYTDPVWFCDNALVTINMQLGDSGIGSDGDDVILGTSGNDYISGRTGNDIICAGDGNDIVFGGRGNDTIFGEAGEDRLSGLIGVDYLDGGDDDDLLYGGSGSDELFGGDGDDFLYGNGENDLLRGGLGDDDLFGGFNNDILRGGLGDDNLSGGPGTDDCAGGPGAGAVDTCEPAL